MRVGGRGDRIPGYMGRLRDEREPASGRWGQAVASWVVARGVTVIFWTDLPGKAKRAQRAESTLAIIGEEDEAEEGPPAARRGASQSGNNTMIAATVASSKESTESAESAESVQIV